MNYTEDMLKIAKFMGLTPIKGFNEATGNTYYYYNDEAFQSNRPLPWYDTWEEIMPVVVKIESNAIEDLFKISGNQVRLSGETFIGVTKLEAIIKAVNWWIGKYQLSTVDLPTTKPTIEPTKFIKFNDTIVTVFKDNCDSPKLDKYPMLGYQARNPNGFYTGLVFRDDFTGKMTTADGSDLPTVSNHDSELVVKSVIFHASNFPGESEILSFLTEVKTRTNLLSRR